MKENTEKTVIKADTRFVQLLISAAVMADEKPGQFDKDSVRIMYSRKENTLTVFAINLYSAASHIVDCAQMGITVETGGTDRPGGVLIKADQILKYFKKFTRPARGIVELEIDWEQGCYTLTGDAGIDTYKICPDTVSDIGKVMKNLFPAVHVTQATDKTVFNQKLLAKLIKSAGLTPHAKQQTKNGGSFPLVFTSVKGQKAVFVSHVAAGIEYRYAVMPIRPGKTAGTVKDTEKTADHSGDATPKDTKPGRVVLKAKGSIRVKNNGTQPADHSGDTAPQDTKPAEKKIGDTARTVKDTKKTPEKTPAEKKTAPTADRLAEKIGAVRSVTPKMRDRLVTAVKRGDEIEKALLYAFGSLKGRRVGECRKIITAAAM